MEKSNKNWLVTLLLCLLFGIYGFHRFYAGKIVSGVFQLLTFGGLGIWTLIDIIMILCGTFKDGDNKIILNEV